MVTIYISEAIPKQSFTENEENLVFGDVEEETIESRLETANMYKVESDISMPVYCDAMNDNFINNFPIFPAAILVIKGNKVIYCSEEGPYGYSPQDLKSFLENYAEFNA